VIEKGVAKNILVFEIILKAINFFGEMEEFGIKKKKIDYFQIYLKN